jgi:hypothetical protein
MLIPGACKDLPDDPVLKDLSLFMKSMRLGLKPATSTEWPYMFKEGLHCGHQGRQWYHSDSIGGSFPLWADSDYLHGEPQQLFSVPPGLNVTDTQGRVISGPVESAGSNVTSYFQNMSAKLQLKELNMVYISDQGDIVKPEKCQTWCIRPEGPWAWGQRPGEAGLDEKNEHCKNRTIELQMDAPVVENVISLMDGAFFHTYHGPFDIVSSLVSVNASILRSNSTYIQIPEWSNYMTQWLDIVGIPADRIVGAQPRPNATEYPTYSEDDETERTTGVWAKHLYVPHWKLHFPNSMQLHWLQAQVWRRIGIPDISSRNRLVIIKREMRGVSNYDDVFLPIVNEYASAHNLQVSVHDDKHLPTVREQLRMFADAKVIVAPHGAGEGFTIATAPGACLIELFKPCYSPNNFARQSALLGLHYLAVALKQENMQEMKDGGACMVSNAPVDGEELRAAMQKCSKVI